MAKIKNNFALGIIDKDSDERFVQNGTIIDAENFIVNTSEGSDKGVGRNVTGNILASDYVIPGAKTIGVGNNPAKEKIYNLVSGSFHDYVLEFDTTTNTTSVVLQSSVGGVLNFNPNKRILNVDLVASGEEGGDLLLWSGDDNPPRVVNIERAKTWAIDDFTEDEISVMKPSPIFAPQINLTTSIDGINNNFLNDKFICFAYRYKFSDGFYSAPSSWSRIAFEPNRFLLDYQTYENNGMLNLSNAANITFNVGPRDVTEVELLFRESDNTTVYVIESFNKEKEGWTNNSNRIFQFSKSKIFKVLSEDQYFRNFDNVPLSVVAQTLIGNRVAYANYIEGYDVGVDIDFDVTFESTEPVLDEITPTIQNEVELVDYSNKSDFERKETIGGSNPIDQMNFLTNEVEVNLSVAGSPDAARFSFEVRPRPSFSGTTYSIYVKQGTTTLSSLLNVSGNQTLNYNRGTNGNVSVFVVSNDGLIYDLELTYRLTRDYGIPSEFPVSTYSYFADHQLSFPKSTGYDLSTLVGDTIIDIKTQYDMSTFNFVTGNQIRINFELQSSLVQAILPSVTFFYNITSDFTDFTDFFTNSDFKEILENAFSENFRVNEISNEGTLVTYQGFLATQVGSNLVIETPRVVYTVTEPSTAVESKNEFFLINEADLFLVSNDSFASMHSNRDYEVCQIYLDSKGRKSTALVSKNNTVYIPAENSTTVNKLKVTLNHEPPTWAKYYKFGIKQVKRQYETIYGNQVYKKGIYRWIKLVGENKNKVKEGDVLILKSDYSGPLTEAQKIKVLEVSSQERDFIKDNQLSTGVDLIEESGLYMKIKQGPFNINIDDNTFRSFGGFGKRRYASRSFVSTTPLFGEINESNDFEPYEVKSGTQINFEIEISAKGSIEFRHVFNVDTVAQEDYLSIKDWWDAEIAVLDSWVNYANDFLNDFEWEPDGSVFRVKPWRNGTASRDISTRITFDVNFSGGTLVFETEPIEALNSPFFETPNVYEITNGEHEAAEHVLNDAFNCFSFGNGVESYKIKDTFIGKTFSIDSNPTAVNEEGYKRIHRFADITYSGIFNDNSNVNRLNEFNLSLANYKEDIEKAYGPIMKIKGQDTNLEVYQEDKCSIVFYGKDLLYNADGTSNISRIEDVLGQQKTYAGEYGISFHPDSFDDFATNSFFTDVKRGVVMRKNDSNGLQEISSRGMRSYFKKLFRDNVVNEINGHYDQFHDYYILNIKYNENQYVTWIYSDIHNGWFTRVTFNPEDMIRVNNDFFSFKNGQVYKHNQDTIFNTFYGVETPSNFTFNFSQDPSTRKHFKNIEIEGQDAWQIELLTDLDSGYINKEDFFNKENVWYAYVRNANNTIKTELLSVQGIGECIINGNVLEFDFDLDSVYSIGDLVLNTNLEIVGTITNKTSRTLTLNAVANIVSGDYVLCSKPQSIENQNLLGYYMQVKMTLQKNTSSEIFSVNSEISRSFE